MRLLPALLLLPALSGCAVRTAIVDSNARESKRIEARKTCWELPRERVFETAKEALAYFGKYQIETADPDKGRIETYPRNEATPSSERNKRHQVVVQLATEGTCTRVNVTAPVQVYWKDDGWTDTDEDSSGISYAVQLKIDEHLKALK
jgi:hypothetical protein